jgi:hypothetical protein
MKTKTSFIFLFALLATALNVSALSFTELAGVYECKTTERVSDQIVRYNETLVICPDGHVFSYTEEDGISTYFSGAYVRIDEDGNWVDEEGNVTSFPRGKFTLRGNDKHVELDIFWTPFPTVDVTIRIKGQRTDDSWEDWVGDFPG